MSVRSLPFRALALRPLGRCIKANAPPPFVAARSFLTSTSKLSSSSTATPTPPKKSTTIMGVEKILLQEGTGAIPRKGQTVTIEYTGYLRDVNAENEKGEQFVSSANFPRCG